MAPYADFFALFNDFTGYVDFYFFQELVDDDYRGFRFFAPFAEFRTPPIPATLGGYTDYPRLTLDLVASRNQRIAAYARGNKTSHSS